MNYVSFNTYNKFLFIGLFVGINGCFFFQWKKMPFLKIRSYYKYNGIQMGLIFKYNKEIKKIYIKFFKTIIISYSFLFLLSLYGDLFFHLFEYIPGIKLQQNNDFFPIKNAKDFLLLMGKIFLEGAHKDNWDRVYNVNKKVIEYDSMNYIYFFIAAVSLWIYNFINYLNRINEIKNLWLVSSLKPNIIKRNE
jgi:hypothetical protein